MTTALGGIRVLDQTQVMAGPFCSMLLADMGADVVKIEPPGGEHTRREQEIAPGVSASFLAVNRNKRSLVLDLKQPDGVAVLKRLVATADVLVENYRPGVARRLGIDHETLSAINPRLIYCSISGFGRTGPYADRGGYDLIAQGMSGIMSATGSDDGAPVKVGVPITDLGAGLFAVVGILAALRARRLTGRGQFIDTSLFEAGVALSQWEATQYWYTGEVPRGLGTAHYSRIVSGSTPTVAHHSRYANGEISDGLISLRPPQNTFVYETSIPIEARCSSMARLCASTVSFSVPCATAMMLTWRNSSPPSRQ